MSRSDYPHLVTITVCPICGRYKPRQAITCGYHETLNARCVQIIDDYERALANAAKRAIELPRKSAKPQLPCDIGLFSDDMDQLDLCEMFQEPTNDMP